MMLKPKDDETKEAKTYRFEVDIVSMRNGDRCPEIYFSDLLEKEVSLITDGFYNTLVGTRGLRPHHPWCCP